MWFGQNIKKIAYMAGSINLNKGVRNFDIGASGDKYISCPYSMGNAFDLNFNNNRTFNFVIRSLNSGTGINITKINPTNVGKFGYAFLITSTNFRLHIYTPALVQLFVFTISSGLVGQNMYTLSLRAWNMTNVEATLYKNGTFINTLQSTDITLPTFVDGMNEIGMFNPSTATPGAAISSSTQYAMYDLKVFNKVLSSLEVSDMYNNLVAPTSAIANLIADVDLTKLQSNKFKDRIAANNDFLNYNYAPADFLTGGGAFVDSNGVTI